MRIIKVVCGLIFDYNNVLICRRKLEKSLGGYWEFPGGKIENDEFYEDALTRELKEELDLEVEIDSHFLSNIHHYENSTIELISFLCRGKRRELKSTDHDKIEWVKYNDLLEWNLAPADIPIAKKLIEDLERLAKEVQEEEDEFNALFRKKE